MVARTDVASAVPVFSILIVRPPVSGGDPGRFGPDGSDTHLGAARWGCRPSQPVETSLAAFWYSMVTKTG